MTAKLKIFIGYAAGVGKTYRMLDEAQRLKAQGVDVVVGYFESHGRTDTIAKLGSLEIIPRKKVEYRGAVFEEMDTDAILARRPEVALVDELAHTNVPGSKYGKRWQDIQALLESGIDVWATMNIQHLESLNDQVFQITGVRVRETVPDWVVRQAGEVVMVDVTPRALLHRLERGVVYSQEKGRRAMENFFRESTLVALRELALRETAHEVEHRGEAVPQPVRDRILVFVTADPAVVLVIRRAKRVADFLGAECFAVTVEQPSDRREDRDAQREATQQHLNFARNLHIETRILEGRDPAAALLDFARRNGITQIYLGRPQQRRMRWRRDLTQTIVNMARDMHAVIVSQRQSA